MLTIKSQINMVEVAEGIYYYTTKFDKNGNEIPEKTKYIEWKSLNQNDQEIVKRCIKEINSALYMLKSL